MTIKKCDKKKKKENKMETYLKEEARKQNADMLRRLDEAEHLLNSTRAGKLLKKGKPFIVIAIDEPYFPQAYRLIRKNETAKGMWTEKCEQEFRRNLDIWLSLP